MDVLKSLIFCLIIFFCTNLFAQTQDCTAIINDVGNYLKGSDHSKISSDVVKNWKKISWIEKNLGAGTKSEVINKTYFWDDFGLITVNNNAIAKIGTIPKSLSKVSLTPIPDLGLALDTLGKPTKINTKTFYRYSWVCSDTNSNLIANATASGEVLSVTGMSCANNMADSTSSGQCLGFSSLQEGQKSAVLLNLRKFNLNQGYV